VLLLPWEAWEGPGTTQAVDATPGVGAIAEMLGHGVARSAENAQGPRALPPALMTYPQNCKLAGGRAEITAPTQAYAAALRTRHEKGA
jgi:hypothetical protein